METKVFSFNSSDEEWGGKGDQFHVELDFNDRGELDSGRLFNDKGSLITKCEQFYHIVNNGLTYLYGDERKEIEDLFGDDLEVVQTRQLIGFRQKKTGLTFGIQTIYSSWSEMEYGDEFYIITVSDERREQNPFDSYQMIDVRDIEDERIITYKYGT